MDSKELWWEIKFKAWYNWHEFVHFWKYGRREAPDDTWVTFKLSAEAKGNKDEDKYSFIEYIEELELYFGGSSGWHGTGCNGWVDGPPDRMEGARKKLVSWFTKRGVHHIYVSGLRNYHKPYPHPALGR